MLGMRRVGMSGLLIRPVPAQPHELGVAPGNPGPGLARRGSGAAKTIGRGLFFRVISECWPDNSGAGPRECGRLVDK